MITKKDKFDFRFLRPLASVVAFALGLGMATTSQAIVVFDNITNFESTGSGAFSVISTPDTFMGDAYVLAPGTTNITGFDLFPVNATDIADGTGTNFTGFRTTVYVWGGVNTGAVSETSPAFSNLLGSYTITTTGNYVANAFSGYKIESATPGVTPGFTLPTVLALDTTTIGITINVQGTTDGINYASIDLLTSLFAYGSPPAVGSEVFNGYYRNVASESDGNFISPLRDFGFADNGSLALRVYGDVSAVPEPSSWLLVASAVGMTLAWRRSSSHILRTPDQSRTRMEQLS